MGLDITAYRKLTKIDAVFDADGEPIDPNTRESIDYDLHAYLNPDFPGRAEAEGLRVALFGIASVNPAERGIEWAKSYASDGLNGAGSEMYARWLDAFKEAEALRKAFMRMRNVAAGYSNCCEFDSANTRRLEREFEAADELFRSSAAMTAKEA